MKAPDYIKSLGINEIDEGVIHTDDDGDYIESRDVEKWLNGFRELELYNFARMFNIDKEDVMDYLENN